MGVFDIEYFNKNKENVNYDSLTKVLSRSSFYQYMQYLIDSNRTFSYFFFDFDDFKSINDVLGHHSGDEALVIAATRIDEVVCKYNGVTGRFGGDEFFAIFENLTEYDDVWKIAKEINEKVREEKSISNIQLALPAGMLTITTGIARFPKDGKTMDELFEVTDKALYRGKQKGKNCFIIYNHELHKDIFKDKEARKLDVKNLINYVFVSMTDKDYSLNENLKHVGIFVANYFGVSIFSKNYNNKFEIIYSNWKMKDPFYVDEKLFLDLKASDDDSMIFMYVNNLNEDNELKKAFEKQNVHASILISCQTKTKLYGYLRVDSKYERIWTKNEKIVFQIIANLYALLLEFKNEEF